MFLIRNGFLSVKNNQIKKEIQIKAITKIKAEMSWLRSSPLRQSFTRRTQEIATSGITDHRAVIDSFGNHWEQVRTTIEIGKSEVSIKQYFHHECNSNFCNIFCDLSSCKAFPHHNLL